MFSRLVFLVLFVILGQALLTSAHQDDEPVAIERSANQVRKVLQTGGNTLQPATAKALNEYFGTTLVARDWGRKLEALKKDFGLANNHHGKIWSDGDYSDTNNNVYGNLTDY